MGLLLVWSLLGCDDATMRGGSGRPHLDLDAAPSDPMDTSLPPIAGGRVDAGIRDAYVRFEGDGAPDDACAWLDVEASRTVPIVHLVVDASASMTEGVDPPWQQVAHALFASPGGVVSDLDRLIDFSATYYSDAGGTCPTLTQVAPRSVNLYPIQNAYDDLVPAGLTPTAEAIDAVVEQWADAGRERPQALLLATDGTPTGCGALTSSEAIDGVVQSARRAFEAGVPVRVIGLGNLLSSAPGMQRAANVGQGLAEDASPGATVHSPSDADALQTTLRELAGNVLDCRLSLRGSLVLSRACEGTVSLDGEALTCDGEDGWRALDATHIELVGHACALFQTRLAARVSARFPCGVVELL